MKRNTILAIFAIASVGVILAVAAFVIPAITNTHDNITYIPKRVLTISSGENSLVPEPESAAECGDSLADVKSKAPFPVLTPTVMISGYSLKGADATADRIQLFYHDKHVCGENAETMEDGVLQLHGGPLNTVDDARNGKDFADKYQKLYLDSGMQAYTYELANGMHGVGYESGVGTSHYIEDGTEAFTKDYQYPASLWVIDDSNHVAYRLKAFLPLEDLVRIGGSLKEST